MVNLSNKTVWNLTVDEIEYIYTKLHMNNYVYAGLMTYHKSNPPLNKIVTLKKETVPECLHESTEKMIGLSAHLGNDDPTTVRVHYTYYAYCVYSALQHLSIMQIDRAVEFLSTLAYIPIIAEKNDSLLLWKNDVIRRKTAFIENRFNQITKKMVIDAFVNQPFFENDKNDDPPLKPIDKLFDFTPRIVSPVLTMIENGVSRQRALKAFQIAESKMVAFERKHGLGNNGSFPKNVKYVSQARYRNTLYLYGGNLLERMGRYDEAFDWYTKDLYYVDLYDTFGFYLTSLKTCERLLCALRVASSRKEVGLLRDLIKNCIKKAFQNAADYAKVVLDYVHSTPNIDLTLERFNLKNKKYMLYGGEPSREVFLSCLLYNKIMHKVDYKNIPYDKYLLAHE